MAAAMRFAPLRTRALRPCYDMASRRQHSHRGPKPVPGVRYTEQLFPIETVYKPRKKSPKKSPKKTPAEDFDIPYHRVFAGHDKYMVAFTPKKLFIKDRKESVKDKWRHGVLGLWLRDNCRCPKCVNQETMQRSYNILSAPTPTIDGVTMDVMGIRVTWGPDQHESFYSWPFLEHWFKTNTRERTHHPATIRRLWGSEIKNNPPTVEFAEVMASERGVAKMTDHIARLGFVFVDETPFDDAIHTKRLLERIGPIRETHYGGFYDFTPDMAKADTAYSNIALSPHTDTTYFTDPAGLQAFHLLSHTSSPDAPKAFGGESLLVDGFHAARLLKNENKDHFSELTGRCLSWHASGNKGVAITTEQLFPVIELDTNFDFRRPPAKIRWNNDDRGVMPLNSKEKAKEIGNWYDAAAKFESILSRQNVQYRFQLKPGRTVIFDNHRILHGRTAFMGLRRICGGYINMDDFMSRWRNTNMNHEKVVAQVIG